MSRPLFFSIVIPAHNEEGYIAKNLEYLKALTYPKDAYEVIVVENGSSDKTFAEASAFATSPEKKPEDEPHVHVFSLKEAGVSKARNFGSSKANKAADWVFFLDADTYIDPSFLQAVSDFIAKHPKKDYVVGTAQLRPYPAGVFMEFWYFWTNLGFRLFHAAYGGALFVKHPLLSVVSFDECLEVGEDESLAKQLRTHGDFFFFPNHLARTSSRRFQNGGWKKIPVWVGMWIFAMIVARHATLTASFQRRFKYKVVR